VVPRALGAAVVQAACSAGCAAPAALRGPHGPAAGGAVLSPLVVRTADATAAGCCIALACLSHGGCVTAGNATQLQASGQSKAQRTMMPQRSTHSANDT
jgi:hypothetical protein